MKAKKIVFGLVACIFLVAISCEPNTTAQEDELYEAGIDKGSIVLKGQKSSDIDKSSIVLKSKDIDKSSIVLKSKDIDKSSVVLKGH